MTAHAVVERPGPFSTIQDLGRRTGRRLGLAPGGAMDQRAYLWANYLLDNEPSAAALEIGLGGLAIRFDVDTTVALTGADCLTRLDGEAVGTWRTLRVRSAQTLALGFSATAGRAYLGFPGGLDAPSAFGSSSTVLREGLPGPLGRTLRVNDLLRWRVPDRAVPLRRVPADQVRAVPSPIALPLITGYEWSAFSDEDRERAFDAEWTVDSASDRTACRLSGPALRSGPVELDSVPLVDGTVQVTGDGTPLVFMRDRPTIGGYAKLGSVDPVALDLLAQASPGARVCFVRADPELIRRGLVRRAEFFGLT